MPDPLRLEVAHEVPGRLRARCPGLRERPELAARLEEAGRELPGIERVSVRPATGSVVFEYSLEDVDPARFHAALAAKAELVAGARGRPPAAGRKRVHRAPRPLGARLIRAVRHGWRRADHWVLRESRGNLDLTSTMPWVLVFLSLRQIFTHPRLPGLPWYNAFYYGLQAILRYPEDVTAIEDLTDSE